MPSNASRLSFPAHQAPGSAPPPSISNMNPKEEGIEVAKRAAKASSNGIAARSYVANRRQGCDRDGAIRGKYSVTEPRVSSVVIMHDR